MSASPADLRQPTLLPKGNAQVDPASGRVPRHGGAVALSGLSLIIGLNQIARADGPKQLCVRELHAHISAKDERHAMLCEAGRLGRTMRRDDDLTDEAASGWM